MSNKYFCVDIGGTKTAFACFDENGAELFYKSIPTLPEQGAENLILRICNETEGMLDGVESGVIASAGPLDIKNGKIEYVATMGWKNVPVVKLFKDRFGVDFLLLNDCDAGALGVWRFAFPQYKNLCYISISTGIGGGAIVNGTLMTGRGNAANFGHIPVSGEGYTCPCGNTDCLELYASGSGMERRYRLITGEKKSCAEIADMARSGDKIAQDIFTVAGEKLRYALKVIVATIDPEIVVLGGSVCKSADLLGLNMNEPKTEYAPSHGKQVLYGALAYGLINKINANKEKNNENTNY